MADKQISFEQFLAKNGANNFKTLFNRIYDEYRISNYPDYPEQTSNILDITGNPNEYIASVSTDKDDAWHYRMPKSYSETGKDCEHRISLNVYQHKDLVENLDKFLEECCQKNIMCYYKTPGINQTWNDRHDPITIYFYDNDNPIPIAIQEEIVKIANPYVREELKLGTEISKGVNVDINPNSKKIRELIDDPLSPSIANAIYDYLIEHKSNSFSTGQYHAIQEIKRRYKDDNVNPTSDNLYNMLQINKIRSERNGEILVENRKGKIIKQSLYDNNPKRFDGYIHLPDTEFNEKLNKYLNILVTLEKKVADELGLNDRDIFKKISSAGYTEDKDNKNPQILFTIGYYGSVLNGSNVNCQTVYSHLSLLGLNPTIESGSNGNNDPNIIIKGKDAEKFIKLRDKSNNPSPEDSLANMMKKNRIKRHPDAGCLTIETAQGSLIRESEYNGNKMSEVTSIPDAEFDNRMNIYLNKIATYQNQIMEASGLSDGEIRKKTFNTIRDVDFKPWANANNQDALAIPIDEDGNVTSNDLNNPKIDCQILYTHLSFLGLKPIIKTSSNEKMGASLSITGDDIGKFKELKRDFAPKSNKVPVLHGGR